ncbi:hypothetical protein OTU49_010531 [Cherax quadricarinatus]|uniref:Uncharacterized protein n=1 Tax=Cherax quadricarinatus TaxID=27406 RepID=A0AAW0WF46_CHEQU
MVKNTVTPAKLYNWARDGKPVRRKCNNYIHEEVLKPQGSCSAWGNRFDPRESNSNSLNPETFISIKESPLMTKGNHMQNTITITVYIHNNKTSKYDENIILIILNGNNSQTNKINQ